MILEPYKLLQQAQKAYEDNDFETVRKIKKRFETEEGLIPSNVMEFFESNFEPEIFENAEEK